MFNLRPVGQVFGATYFVDAPTNNFEMPPSASYL